MTRRRLRVWVTLAVLGFLVLMVVMLRPAAIEVTFSNLPTEPGLQYWALNLPRSQITLPALFVGAQRELSPECFETITPAAAQPAVSAMIQDVERDRRMDDTLQGRLRATLTEGGAAAQVASSLIERVQTRMYGMYTVEVETANIRPNFKNEACRSVSLGWFTNGRVVAIGAIKVDSLFVDVTGSLDAHRQADVRGAMQKLNTDLGVSLSRANTSRKALSYSGKNLYVGVTTTQLHANRCTFIVQGHFVPGSTRHETGCDSRYRVSVERFRDGDTVRVILTVPQEGLSTGPVILTHDNDIVQQPLGTIRYVFESLGFERSFIGDHLGLEVTVLEVGASGAESP